MLISLGLPKVIPVELAQVSDLRSYEIFSLSVSASFNVAVAFWTAWATSGKGEVAFLASAITFTATGFFFLFFAYKSRKRIFGGIIKESIPINISKG